MINLKNSVLFLVILFCNWTASAQVVIKGKVEIIYQKQLEDSGSKIISATHVSKMSFYLSDNKFIVGKQKYLLSDKDTMTINKEMVISYVATNKKDMKLLAASEIAGKRNYIRVALFSLTENSYYTEYLVKIKSL